MCQEACYMFKIKKEHLIVKEVLFKEETVRERERERTYVKPKEIMK